MVKVGVIGASGYTGLELIKMIINHPKFELRYLATSQGDITIGGSYTHSLRRGFYLSM